MQRSKRTGDDGGDWREEGGGGLGGVAKLLDPGGELGGGTDRRCGVGGCGDRD